MRHLYKLGVTAFDDSYTATSVSAYLLSIRLKSVGVAPKDLCEFIHTSIRTAQRYIYNGHRSGNVCISTIHHCLIYLNVPLAEFFADVDLFLKQQSYAALYDLETKVIVHYTKTQFKQLSYCEYELKEIVYERMKFVRKCGLSVAKQGTSTYDNRISKFPSDMIKDHFSAISN